MKHTKITVGFATLLCIFSLAGCQSKPQNQPVETETEMQQTNTVSEPQTEQPQQESSETHPNNVPAFDDIWIKVLCAALALKVILAVLGDRKSVV